MDEDLTGRTGDLLAGLAMFRDASVPVPSAELTAMFAATADTTASSALPNPRRTPVYKRIFAGIPSKIAAGALGALLAGSVGAGALTGTMVLTSNEDDAATVEAPAVDDGAVVADEHEDDAAEVADESSDDVDEVAVDEVDDDGANDAADDADLAAVPVPTSVSEAAHTHEFDEACGNHGHYVSAFAQTGAEPECATEARTAAAADSAAAEDQVVAGDASSPDAAATDTAVEPSKHEGKVKASGRASTSGGNWQLPADQTSSKGGKSNKGKGGR